MRSGYDGDAIELVALSVSALANPDYLVEIEVVAVKDAK
jgi:hypothetical protein